MKHLLVRSAVLSALAASFAACAPSNVTDDVADTSVSDAGTLDSGTQDVATHDTSTTDTATADTGPMTGCNGYLRCLTMAMTQADADACDAATTQHAMDLLNAVNMCVTMVCFTPATDGGAPACTSNTDMSAGCTSCIQGSVGTGGACASGLAACRADLP